MIEGSEKTTSQFSSISGHLTMASLEIVECLIDSNNSNSNTPSSIEFIELLGFPHDNPTNFGFPTTTDFKIKFKYTQKAVRHGQITRFAHPYIEFGYIFYLSYIEFHSLHYKCMFILQN